MLQRTDAAQTVRREFCRDLLAGKSKAAQQKMTARAVDQILARDCAVTGWLNDHSISSAPPLSDIIGTDQPIATATVAPVTRRPLMVWPTSSPPTKPTIPGTRTGTRASIGPGTCGT